jgi:hypothetical protein
VNIKVSHITLIVFLLALAFVVLSKATESVRSTSNYCLTIGQLETAAKDESNSAETRWKRPKPRSTKIKFVNQIFAVVLVEKLSNVEQRVILRSSNRARSAAQISFVRYLPRDPPTA